MCAGDGHPLPLSNRQRRLPGGKAGDFGAAVKRAQQGPGIQAVVADGSDEHCQMKVSGPDRGDSYAPRSRSAADYFMTAEEAKEYGLIDKVLARRSEPDARPAS